jgi:hypothetical protein
MSRTIVLPGVFILVLLLAGSIFSYQIWPPDLPPIRPRQRHNK